MKIGRCVCALLFALTLVSHAETAVTPDDLLAAVDQMTPAQVLALSQKLEARFWDPIPEGFFSRMVLDVAVRAARLESTGAETLSLSGGDMDLRDVGGMDIGVLWRLPDPRARLGFRVDSFGAEDDNLRDAGYSRAELIGGGLSVPLQVQWVRGPRWLFWTDASAGIASMRLTVLDTPHGEPTTQRVLDRNFWIADLQAGGAFQLNPVVSLFAAGGYRFADSVKLKEGGRTTDLEFDAGGGFARLGVGFNF